MASTWESPRPGELALTGTALAALADELDLPTVSALVHAALAGLTAANVAVALAYISDITPEAERARRFGLFQAFFGAGFALGFGSLPDRLDGLDPERLDDGRESHAGRLP